MKIFSRNIFVHEELDKKTHAILYFVEYSSRHVELQPLLRVSHARAQEAEDALYFLQRQKPKFTISGVEGIDCTSHPFLRPFVAT